MPQNKVVKVETAEMGAPPSVAPSPVVTDLTLLIDGSGSYSLEIDGSSGFLLKLDAS